MDSSGNGPRTSDRMGELERRLERLEWRERAADRSRRLMGELVPADTRQHLRAAGREQLLAVRSLVDHWIGRLGDEKDEPAKRREEIPIE